MRFCKEQPCIMNSTYVTGVSLFNGLGATVDDVMRRLYLNTGQESNLSIRTEFDSMFEILTRKALRDAGLSIEEVNNCKSLVIACTSAGNVFENAHNSTYLVDDYTRDFFAGPLQADYLHVSAACTSSAEAIALGCDFIQSAHYDLVICFGVDIVDRYRIAGHNALGTIAASRCRPFSRQSNGTLFKDGAACVVLESACRVRARGVRSLCEIIGYASMTDNTHFTAPDTNAKGAIGVMQKSIYRSGVDKDDISYVNAHGTGTRKNDEMEVKAMNAVFSGKKPLFSSTKAAHGHMLGATAMTEIIVCIYAQQNRLAPPTYGVSNEADLYEGPNYVIEHPRPFEHGKAVMSLAFGFGGTCNAILLR